MPKVLSNKTYTHRNDIFDDNGDWLKTKITKRKNRLNAFEGKKITGYKKAAYKYRGRAYPVVITLEIPARALAIQPNNYKCRASEAKVKKIEIFFGDDRPYYVEIPKKFVDGYELDTAVSTWDYKFKYKVGETVKPLFPFGKNIKNECSSGIHFFLDRKEAEAYS